MTPRIHTRADFDAWAAAQPRGHRVPGADHALWIRWCASVLAAGGRIEEGEAPAAAPAPPAAVAEELPPPVDLDAPFAGLDPSGPLVAYTDGSGTRAHLPCGAGVVIYDGTVAVLEASRYLGHGTNNRAELAAIGLAVATTADPQLADRELVIRTDSEYALGALTRDRDTEDGRPNARLINHIRGMLRGRRVRFEHVPGHRGIPGNERADELAGLARRRGVAAEARAA